jgi:hypothetical protein
MPWKSTDLTGTTKSVAIHAALMPTETGAVIIYFGWESQKTFLYDATPSTPDNPIDDADRVNVPDGNPVNSQDLGHMFCGSESFLADGRLLVGGGVVNQNIDHGGPDHDSGERRSYIYSPLANSWTVEGEISDLNFQPNSNSVGGGRWYPTMTTLGNGEAFLTGGHPYIGKVTGQDANKNNIVDAAGADNSPFPAAFGERRHNNNMY